MALTKEAKDMQNAYLRTWRKRNPEKVRAIQERYLNKRAERMKTNENGRGQES